MAKISVTPEIELDSLFRKLHRPNPNERALIERAYKKAEAAHAGQFRKSGAPFITHCLTVSQILADMNLDAETIAAALLHDVVEDTDVGIGEIREEFGETVSSLVETVTKLARLPTASAHQRSQRYKEYIRKIFLTMGDDVRAVLIKLADRLHNMRTLIHLPAEKQYYISRETMDIFAPLANRLGIWQIKWELEDLSFRFLEPEEYERIAQQIDSHRSDREDNIQNVIQYLRHELGKNGIKDAHLAGRPKHIFSIYSKMQRKGTSFEQIHDIRAVRIIVDTVPQCYLALGIVHNLWRPIPSEFDDYIASPKDNFYQSLHTALLDNDGKTIEIQIRTREMHENAEYGIAAHWRYKEGRRGDGHDPQYEKRLNFIRRLMEFGNETSADDDNFLDTLKTEVFEGRVYVFTPQGDIVDLPAGATPIDLAYYIHTEIGHHCRGAKVMGNLVNLNYRLQNADQVEILTSKRSSPSLDWLNPHLGYVKTSRARSKIRLWYRKQNFEHHITLGRESLERELKRIGFLERLTYEQIAALFKFDDVDKFLAAIGSGDINTSQIAGRILETEQKDSQNQRGENSLESLLRPRLTPHPNENSGVKVAGMSGLLINLARCCNPMPGDQIIGFITRGRGLTVHHENCSNIKAIDEPERLLEVSWDKTDSVRLYSVPISIIAYDRSGLMRDISTLLADEKINLSEVSVSTKQEIATLQLTLEISDLTQLGRVMTRVEVIPSVIEVYRRQPV